MNESSKSRYKGNKWIFRGFMYFSIISMLLVLIFLDPIIENHQNKNEVFCNNSKFLRTVEDDNDFFCYINCADKYGCDYAKSDTVMFVEEDGSCKCGILNILRPPSRMVKKIGEFNGTFDQ